MERLLPEPTLELSVNGREVGTRPGQVLGSLETAPPESCYDGVFGLPWGYVSSVCLSRELVGPGGAAQSTSIIFQPGAWPSGEHQGVTGEGLGCSL